MSDDNQILIPPSFIALFVPPGRIKPTEGRAHIAARYELCEDMAQMLVEPAGATRFDLGVNEDEVLQRMQAGLLAPGSVLADAEARWVICRLAELLGWAMLPAPDATPGDAMDAMDDAPASPG